MELCHFPEDQKWQLKYRASRNGFHSKDFHSKCDGIEETLDVIKTTNGNIFGGYTDKAWSSHNENKDDPNTYIFSLVNKEDASFKTICSDNGYSAIGCFLERMKKARAISPILNQFGIKRIDKWAVFEFKLGVKIQTFLRKRSRKG